MLLGLDKALVGFDLVHAPEQTFFFTWQAVRRKAKLGYRVVTTQDEVTPFWYERRRRLLERTREVRRETDLFHARTRRAAMALECEGVAPEPIRTIGHGVNLERFRPDAQDEQRAHALGIDLNGLVVSVRRPAGLDRVVTGRWPISPPRACCASPTFGPWRRSS